MSLFIFKACRKIYKIIGTFTHPFYYLVALFSTRKSIPAITNPILVTSASELAKKIRTGELTCREVVSVFIERCKQVNVIVNAIIQDRFEAAIQDAQKVDAFLHYNQISISQLEKEKPLLGVPVTIKECCSVKGMKLSAGMKQYEKRVAAYNGDAVQKMINAGAIPIAVTSTPPHSLWIETFNDIIGYTSNPYDTRKSAGGSSGGEAALVASGASALGLGSDAGGSIRIPAAFCGIYGHKPTKKFVSSKGHTTFFSNPVAENMLTVGPLCRYAVDLELAMNVLSANKLQESNFCAQIHLRQINIFYLFEFQQNICLVDDAIKKSIKDAIFYLNAEYGCKVKELAIQEFEQILEITFSHSLGLISSVIQENESEMFKRMLKIVHLTSPLDEKIFFKKQKNLQTRLLQLLEDNGVLLLPTWPESACYKYESVWKMINGCYTYFINAMGLTSTAIPVGMDRKKMPVSIQVIAAPTQDRLCISVAAELEKLFGGWMPPRNS